ncbi:MAG: hypothetical protein QXU82_00075 [Candidatus Aenigmatarchaeota archaeon]
MPEFAFVLGKNFDLSAAELVCFLRARGVAFEVTDYSDEFIVIEAKALPKGMIEGLGGTLKIAEVFFVTGKRGHRDISAEMNGLDFEKLFVGLPEKPLFAVSAYGSKSDQNFFPELLKQRMKEVGLSPGYIHSDEPLTHTEVLKKRLLQKGAEFLSLRAGGFRLAKTVAVHNPDDFMKRDVGKPVQRTIFSISPRLCRMMINLSMPKGVLLDPFCGIGCILMEACLLGLDIRGIDIDPKCVPDCRKNLEWLQKEYGLSMGSLEEKIRHGDAKKLSDLFSPGSVDAIVTEPYLGRPLLERPCLADAKAILDEVRPLYASFLKEAAKVLRKGSRAVVISPFFRVGGRDMGLDMAELAKAAGLAQVDVFEGVNLPHAFPLSDFEERHSTLRMINVLQK